MHAWTTGVNQGWKIDGLRNQCFRWLAEEADLSGARNTHAVRRAVELHVPKEFGITELSEGIVVAQSSIGAGEKNDGLKSDVAVEPVSMFSGMT